MKALFFKKYGPPSGLEIRDLPIPEPVKDEVRVKVKVSAINDWDWSMVRGRPRIYRLLYGLFGPRYNVPGMELSGVIDKTGPEVKNLKAGDEVFGDTSDHNFGSLAEYICVSEKALIKKPESITFEEAATIPHAAMLAWQSLIDIADIKTGQKILINGAGGGVGVFGLQIAKAFNAEVSGVDTGGKLEMMKSLGFDHVYDYKKYDFTNENIRYDIILDTKTSRGISSHARVLNEKGIYVTVGGELTKMLSMLFMNLFYSDKRFKLLALKPNKGLEKFLDFMKSRKLRIICDGPYPLEKAAWAIQHFGEGRHKGKVLISMEQNR